MQISASLKYSLEFGIADTREYHTIDLYFGPLLIELYNKKWHRDPNKDFIHKIFDLTPRLWSQVMVCPQFIIGVNYSSILRCVGVSLGPLWFDITFERN